MKKEFFFLSKDERTSIHAIEWKPEGEIAGVLQICHGMAEYIERYDEFAAFLARNGYCVIGHDHLGHGKSVLTSEQLGYFHETKGNDCVIEDIHELHRLTSKKYPDVPYFIMGHSMGSFLVRQYLGKYKEKLSGAIVMGTGEQPMIILQAGRLVCRVIALLKGWKHRSKFVDSMAAGGYEKAFANVQDGSNWLSRNPENVKRYKADPLCGYVFTVNGYYNMFLGMSRMLSQEKNEQIPKEIPVFLVAGSEDPVGNFGKSVKNVYRKYKKCGIQDVELKLYEKDRHEILNEDDREVVYGDILTWLENHK